MKIGSPLCVMSTSSSLFTVTPVFVKMEIVLSSAVLPTLISELGKSLKVSARDAVCDSCQKGSCVTFSALLMLPLATPIHLFDLQGLVDWL